MSRKRIRRSLTLMVLRERAPVVLVVVLVLALTGWGMVSHWDRGMELCLARYARARTAEDTARVDRIGQTARRSGCGASRRNGTLDRHRRAMERRAAAAGDPLIEK